MSAVVSEPQIRQREIVCLTNDGWSGPIGVHGAPSSALPGADGAAIWDLDGAPRCR
jgi:hypothetical protein